MANTTYDETDGERIAQLFVGRKVVRAEKGAFPIPGADGSWNHSAEGVLELDDGTVLYLTGNDGGCACSAGCYPLAEVASVDNIITSAHVNADPDDDDSPLEHKGVYQIFVFADAKRINVATFEGSDGNGYYGTGFSLTVVKPGE
jgi:hypothetical protein